MRLRSAPTQSRSRLVALRRTLGVFLIVIVAAILLGRAASYWWISSQPTCAELPRRVGPVDVHLVASLDEHRSWVDFPLAEAPSRFAFCADGRLLNDDPVALVGWTGRLGVRTTWIDLLWAGALLPDYTNQAHWELRYSLPSD